MIPRRGLFRLTCRRIAKTARKDKGNENKPGSGHEGKDTLLRRFFTTSGVGLPRCRVRPGVCSAESMSRRPREHFLEASARLGHTHYIINPLSPKCHPRLRNSTYAGTKPVELQLQDATSTPSFRVKSMEGSRCQASQLVWSREVPQHSPPPQTTYFHHQPHLTRTPPATE